MKNIPDEFANILYAAEEIEKLSGDCRTWSNLIHM